ncbi:MAG: hypothetical protein ACERKV_14425 [Clostridiaceae bacterium]
MKLKKINIILLVNMLIFTSVCHVSAMDGDGSKYGKVISKKEGKIFQEFPITKEVKELQEDKSIIAELYMREKKGEISKDEYNNEIKKLNISNNDLFLNIKSISSKNIEYTVTIDAIESATASETRIWDLVQQSQQTNYYCGPATASEIIKARINSLYSQSSLASDLRCTTSGTAWYDGAGKTGYPMADTLNKFCSTMNWYAPYGTNVDTNKFKDHIVFDIDMDYGVAGDAYEVVGGKHLIGHPDKNIFHWFAIDGYKDYGNVIWYLDSVSGSSSISWSSSVPKYSSMNAIDLAEIVNGRGIIW